FLLAAGIFVGLVIGVTISPARRNASTLVQASDGGSAVTANLKAKSGSRLESEMEHSNILLGDIMTVPFQELYGVLSTLSPQQLDELAAQLKNLPAGKETNAKVAAFFRAWAHFDSVAALRAAAGFKISEEKTTAVQSVITSADAAQAKALAKQIQEWSADVLTREQRNGFLNSLLVKWSDLDPVGAAKFFDAMQVDAMRFHPAASVIAQSWAAIDPQSASEYAATLTADVREATLCGAINYWAASDLAAAGEWIKGLSGSARDEALGTYAYNLLRKDPNAAAAWAVTISDPKIRDK